jgi:prolyl-tRNA editing enzyme YbaK/EbsC (Cys-tRNA(Pro) deacylase)
MTPQPTEPSNPAPATEVRGETAPCDPFGGRPARDLRHDRSRSLMEAPTRGERPLSPAAQRVARALAEAGYGPRVRELAASTRTAADAAAAVGCAPAQIVKSLLFKGKRSGRYVLVLASGAHRVDAKALGRGLGEPPEMATPEAVHRITGFEVGGVPPLGHACRLAAFVDASLLHHGELWAAAGTPHALFHLTPAELLAMTGGTPIPLAGKPLPEPPADEPQGPR